MSWSLLFFFFFNYLNTERFKCLASNEIYAFIKCEIAHITLMFVSLYLGGGDSGKDRDVVIVALKPVKFQVRLLYYLKRFYLKRCSLSGVNRMCTQQNRRSSQKS